VVTLQINIHNMDVASPKQLIDPPERVFTSDTRAKSVTLRGKLTLEDGFQHHAQRRLNNPVLNSRYPKWTQFLAPRFGDVVPPDRLRQIVAASQSFTQTFQIHI
jgi:hypothetical protein